MQCIHQWRLLLDVKKVQIAGYSRITLCITVFGVLGAWGGIGLELHAPNKIKTVRPARLRHPTQTPTGQGTPNKKRTIWCVSKLVHLIGESWNRFHAEISKNARIIEGSGMLNLIKRAA